VKNVKIEAEGKSERKRDGEHRAPALPSPVRSRILSAKWRENQEYIRKFIFTGSSTDAYTHILCLSLSLSHSLIGRETLKSFRNNIACGPSSQRETAGAIALFRLKFFSRSCAGDSDKVKIRFLAYHASVRPQWRNARTRAGRAGRGWTRGGSRRVAYKCNKDTN